MQCNTKGFGTDEYGGDYDCTAEYGGDHNYTAEYGGDHAIPPFPLK